MEGDILTALSRLEIQQIERYWITHEENRKQLRYLEWELLNPHNEADTNIGGGKSNKISNPTERKAIILADNKKYSNLKSIVEGIDKLYTELDEDLKTIVDMRYWDKEGYCYEWEDIADKLYMSRRKVLRKRNVLIDKTAEVIGFI